MKDKHLTCCYLSDTCLNHFSVVATPWNQYADSKLCKFSVNLKTGLRRPKKHGAQTVLQDVGVLYSWRGCLKSCSYSAWECDLHKQFCCIINHGWVRIHHLIVLIHLFLLKKISRRHPQCLLEDCQVSSLRLQIWFSFARMSFRSQILPLSSSDAYAELFLTVCTPGASQQSKPLNAKMDGEVKEDTVGWIWRETMANFQVHPNTWAL